MGLHLNDDAVAIIFSLSQSGLLKISGVAPEDIATKPLLHSAYVCSAQILNKLILDGNQATIDEWEKEGHDVSALRKEFAEDVERDLNAKKALQEQERIILNG